MLMRVLLALAAAAPQPPAGPLEASVEISAQPAVIHLGRDARVSLELRAPEGPLRVVASTGRIEALAEVSKGRWTATWLPPRARVPSVALIVARAQGAVGFIALPLWGEGRAEVHTRPGAVVEVKIGEAAFGPMRADAAGVATVPVVVPPGLDFATQGRRQIDLHVPRTRGLQLAPLPEALDCDRDRELEVAVAAVARDGTPRLDAPLALSASRGEVGPLRPLAPGLYAALWRIPAGAPGVAVLRAALEGDGQEDTRELRLRAGVAASIELAARAQAAEGAAPVLLDARALDAGGNASEEPLRFSASAGTLSSRPTGPGAYELEVRPPAQLDRAQVLRIVASPAGRAEPVAAAEILLPGARSGGLDLPTEAPAPRRPLSLAARGGFLTDFRGLDASLLGLESSWRGERMEVSLAASWSFASATSAAANALPGDALRTRDNILLASATAALRIPLRERMEAWVGGGPLLAAIAARARVDRPGLPPSETTSRGVAPGAALVAGIERGMWRGLPFLEVRIVATRPFSLPNLEGALVGASLSAGYRFELF